jgi:PPM family protein phosphatase
MNTTTSRTSQSATLDLPFVVHSFGLSDRGRVRPSNEDRFLIMEAPRTLDVHQRGLAPSEVHDSNPPGRIFLVADGMGGPPAGEVASGLAVEAVEEFVLKSSKLSRFQADEEESVLKELEETFLHANARIFEETVKHQELRSMGTTLTMAVVADWTLFVAHAGHSRCYLLTSGKLRQLTQDHTVAAEMVRLGVVSAKAAAHHVYRHVVSNVLGGAKPSLQVELHKHRLRPNDVLLLCSDGLTEMVSDARIAAILRAERDPRRACEQLLAEANKQRGSKNVTVVVARIEKP